MRLTVWFENSTVFTSSTSQPNNCNGKLAALFPAKMEEKSQFFVEKNAAKERTDVAADDVRLDRQNSLLLRDVDLDHRSAKYRSCDEISFEKMTGDNLAILARNSRGSSLRKGLFYYSCLAPSREEINESRGRESNHLRSRLFILLGSCSSSWKSVFSC